MGDPCGVGPEVTVKAISSILDDAGAAFVVCGAPEVMSAAVERYGSKRIETLWSKVPHAGLKGPFPDASIVLVPSGPLSFENLAPPGKPGKAEGNSAMLAMQSGLDLVKSGACNALVTAPVSKASLMEAGFSHPGHTGWLEAETAKKAVMVMVAGRLRVAALTAHIPLSSVKSKVTGKAIMETVIVLDRDLRERFGIKRPRIAVAGLNPHAGEEGRLGNEERKIIAPTIKKLVTMGMDVRGPLPADTMFSTSARKTFDAALCMYHDQAMLPVKTLAMKKAVNVTFGLPIIRTSPAHGTAPDIAWQGKADHKSMVEAIRLAAKMARRHA